MRHDDKLTFRTDKTEICPYCLEYAKEFDVCVSCGLMVCHRSCSVELIRDRLCIDCASRISDSEISSLDYFARRQSSRISGGIS